MIVVFAWGSGAYAQTAPIVVANLAPGQSAPPGSYVHVPGGILAPSKCVYEIPKWHDVKSKRLDNPNEWHSDRDGA